jgi:hypothetical protein
MIKIIIFFVNIVFVDRVSQSYHYTWYTIALASADLMLG